MVLRFGAPLRLKGPSRSVAVLSLVVWVTRSARPSPLKSPMSGILPVIRAAPLRLRPFYRPRR